ncbi:MAG: hypothetical protein JSU67_15390 [Gammaproteobacteria bacterium]|nr:MAG: hypothetical protein EP300_09220 [Gammaproteobacteria bacterium]UCH39522.1 MAG: hypothetical protein JSU67_15390 [Gammaproteobacteria bacterium]
MDWVKIGSAVLLAAMLIYLFPRAKQAVQNSPKGSASDWMGFVIPIVAVVLFVILLISLV